MENLVRDWLKRSHLGTAMDLRRIQVAWNDVTGAGRYTSRIFLKNGRLYVTMTSSVARSQLLFQKRAIIEKINAALAQDSLYSGNSAGGNNIQELIVK